MKSSPSKELDRLATFRKERSAPAICAMTVAFLFLAFAPLFGFESSAQAQTRLYDLTLQGGSGLTLGAGGETTVLQRSRVFLDIGARTWSDEESTIQYGGVLRLEIEKTPFVGGVGRIYMQKMLMESLALRGFGGIAMFVAPKTLLGVEGGVEGEFTIAAGFSVIGTLMIDAYFFGSDLQDDSALLFFNGALGVALAL